MSTRSFSPNSSPFSPFGFLPLPSHSSPEHPARAIAGPGAAAGLVPAGHRVPCAHLRKGSPELPLSAQGGVVRPG